MSLQKAARALSEFVADCHELDNVMTVATLAVYSYIATHPHCAAADISRDLKLSQPATARHLQRLEKGSEGSKAVGRGLEFVEHYPDPADARRRLYVCTDRGCVVNCAISVP